MFSPIFTTPKITTIPPKTPLSPYKIRLKSNSTENIIFNKEITHQNTPIYNSSITKNTSKINTFQQHSIHKQHHSIEVIIFYHQIHIKLTSKIHTNLYLITLSHSLPVILRLNQRKSTQISIQTTSMIKVLPKNKSL